MARLCLAALAIVAVAAVLIETKSLKSELGRRPIGNIRLPLYSQLRKSDGLPDYYTEMAIGTPPQNLKVKIDTTGFDFWVISSQCAKDECKNHAQYDSSKSSSYAKNGRNSSSRSSGMSGFLSTDTLHIGPASLPNVTFGEATAPGEDFKDFAYDAVMGVNFMKPKDGEADNVMDNIKDSQLLKSPTVFFHVDFEIKDGGKIGEIGFGEWDWVDFTQYSRRGTTDDDGSNMRMEYLTVENTTSICEACKIEVVNWANRMVVPYEEAAKLNAALGATKDPTPIKGFEHTWSFPDCLHDNRPTIVVGLAKLEFYAVPQVYMTKSADGKCSSIFAGSEKTDSWQINHQFMSAVYTAFDHSDKSIWFGQRPLYP